MKEKPWATTRQCQSLVQIFHEGQFSNPSQESHVSKDGAVKLQEAVLRDKYSSGSRFGLHDIVFPYKTKIYDLSNGCESLAVPFR
jgi:hypothetical protein